MYGNYAIQGRKLRCCLGVNSKLIVFLVFFLKSFKVNLQLFKLQLPLDDHIFSFKFVFLQFTSSPFQVPFLIMIVVNTLFFFFHFQSSDLFLFMVGQLQKYMPHSPRRSSSRRKGSNREDELE